MWLKFNPHKKLTLFLIQNFQTVNLWVFLCGVWPFYFYLMWDLDLLFYFFTVALTCTVMMTTFVLDHCPFSTGNSNTVTSGSFCLSWNNSFVLSWSGTLPLWRGVSEVPGFCGTSIPKLVFNFIIIYNHVLPTSYQIGNCCSFFKHFHNFLSSDSSSSDSKLSFHAVDRREWITSVLHSEIYLG